MSHIKYINIFNNKNISEEERFEIQNFYKYKMIP